MSISHPSLKLAIFIPYTNASDLSGELITQEIERVLQSNENFRINDGQLSSDITHTRVPEGSGRKPLHHGLYFESENMRTNKRSIVRTDNIEDAMCMARAIMVGKCYAEKENSDSWTQKWNHIKRSNKSLQTEEAMKLLDQANIPHDKPCGIEEYKLIQAVMSPVYLIKVHSQHPKNGLLFPVQLKKQRETKVIHIYWNGDHHYDTITTVTGFLGCSYYCAVNIVISDIPIEEIIGAPLDAMGVIMIFPAYARGRYSAGIVKEPFEVQLVLIIINRSVGLLVIRRITRILDKESVNYVRQL